MNHCFQGVKMGKKFKYKLPLPLKQYRGKKFKSLWKEVFATTINEINILRFSYDFPLTDKQTKTLAYNMSTLTMDAIMEDRYERQTGQTLTQENKISIDTGISTARQR